MTADLAVVVLAAGQGTRMRSRVPKVLHPLAGRPMIAHVLATAGLLEPAHLVVVVRHERDAVAAAVAEVAPHARVVDQDEIPGTGRATEQAVAALGAFDGDVLVLNGDVPLIDEPTIAALVTAHRTSAAAVSLLTARFEDPAGYGRIVRDEAGALARIVEERDATEAERRALDEVNAGVYVFASAGLADRLAALRDANDQGERYLTDVVGGLVADGLVVATSEADPALVAGVNDRVQLSDAARRLNAAIVRGHQLAGVSVDDPATTWIDVDVSLEEDVRLLPGTRLLGATSIARDALIGPDTTLVDCEVGEGASVVRTDATLAVIARGATVGPFTFIRAGTELGADGKIGAFVETKNAQIGEGSKVPHLSYVGDTTVGEHSNIGAGTITANYDGVRKHRTTIGSHVRSASHTVYVAPVSIGDGAYTGAGTIVRKDVPAGALALSIAPQRNILGWVAEHRADTDAARAAAQSSDAALAALEAESEPPTASTEAAPAVESEEP